MLAHPLPLSLSLSLSLGLCVSHLQEPQLLPGDAETVLHHFSESFGTFSSSKMGVVEPFITPFREKERGVSLCKEGERGEEGGREKELTRTPTRGRVFDGCLVGLVGGSLSPSLWTQEMVERI